MPPSSPLAPTLAPADTPATDTRVSLLFGLTGLPAKQELVLKSMMRLLDHKFDHKWFYSSGVMDLCIASEGVPKANFSAFRDVDGAFAHVLIVGLYKKDQAEFLHLPVDVNELWLTVNRIGNTLQRQKAVAIEVQLPSLSVPSDAFLRLKRWPPTHLLNTLDRVRMATLLTGQPLALQELQRKGTSASSHV